MSEDGADQERRAGRGRLSSMDQVGEDGHDEIVWAMGQLNERRRSQADILFELNDRLAVKGIDPISKSAFNRRSVKLAAMNNRLNEARHIFAGLAPQFTAEKVDESTMMLGEFLKVLVFEIAQSDGHDLGAKGAMELAKAHLAVIQGQKLSSERRAKLQAEFKEQAGKAIDQVVRQKGLSEDVRQDLRRDLFGISEPRHGA